MQQAHDFLKESKLLYELLLGRNESDYELITQFKNWSIQDVIGHLYLFNIAKSLIGKTLKTSDN